MRAILNHESGDLAVLYELIANGLLVEAPHDQPWEFARSTVPLRVVDVPIAVRTRRLSDILAMTLASMTVRWFGLETALRGVRRRAAGKRIIDPGQAAALAEAMRFARRWFPAQTLCLIDSIALHRRLRANAIDCIFVIGVRDRPFAAHCWVEAGGALLNDDLDTVGELTPIIRL